MIILYDPDFSLSEHEKKLALMSKKFDLDKDILSILYKNFDHLELTMIEIAKFTKKKLGFDLASKKFKLIGNSSFGHHNEIGQVEYYQKFYEFEAENDLIKITKLQPDLHITKETITVNLYDFIKKTQNITSKINHHQEIFNELINIAPSNSYLLRVNHKPSIIDQDQHYSLKYLTSETSIDPESEYYFGTKKVLSISGDSYKFSHIEEPLNSKQFLDEVEKLKKMNELTNHVKDLIKDKFNIKNCDIGHRNNSSIPLLNNLVFTHANKNFLITNGNVEIRNKENNELESKKSLQDFVSELEQMPSRSPSRTIIRSQSPIRS